MEIILFIYGIGCFFILLIGFGNAINNFSGESSTEGLSHDEITKLDIICLIFYPGYLIGYLFAMIFVLIYKLIQKNS